MRPAWRFIALAVIGLIAATLIAAPWVGLIAISAVYAALIPFSVMGYAKVKRARNASAQAT